MSERTETSTTTHSDGSTTTTTVTYDENGRVTSTTNSTTGPGSVVGIQAGVINDGVTLHVRRR
ncbi:hypothetical protein [Nocardiopsis halophila]|uniref:hypothetical protein n=1 Tax=Nocardiopsis halophila TaxID=141692 RepID=UPI00034865EE|nr:hypothetical protein [Nocardiopsis halophila]